MAFNQDPFIHEAGGQQRQFVRHVGGQDGAVGVGGFVQKIDGDKLGMKDEISGFFQ